MDRLAPANIDAEQALLGSILIDPSAVVRVGALVTAEDFSRPAHGQIFATVVALYTRREAVDIVTVLTAGRSRNGSLSAQHAFDQKSTPCLPLQSCSRSGKPVLAEPAHWRRITPTRWSRGAST